MTDAVGDASTRTFEVPDPADTTGSTLLSYRIRSLAAGGRGGPDPADLKRWADFCAECFAYKPNPPSAEYFERHFRNDPDGDIAMTRIVEHVGEGGGWEISSSMRVFRRRLSTGGGDGETISAGGIGEVCTSTSHRRRSLSRTLMADAIDIMRRRGMELSLLHASPALRGVYERGGNYSAVTSPWSVVGVRSDGPSNSFEDGDDDESGWTIRCARFPEDAPALAALHRRYSESRFVCVARTERYWSEYLSKELGETLQVLMAPGDDEIVAWKSLRDRGGHFQLRDFGVDTERCSTGRALRLLLRKEREEIGAFDLHLPTPVLEELDPEADHFIDWERGGIADDDGGWMYRPIGEGGFDMVAHLKKAKHLIWPADSF